MEGVMDDSANVIVGLIVVIVILVVYLVPIIKILNKAGYSGWWCLLFFVPLVNLIMLWVFAFADWPNLRDRGT
jgi:uncharacterized membrane protein YhaH (DUF805 family)